MTHDTATTPTLGDHESESQPDEPVAPGRGPTTLRHRVQTMLSFRNVSSLYIFAALFVLFSIWVPDTFLAGDTWKALIDTQALTALVAIALVIPVAAGTFNLAIGAEVGAGAILVAWLIGKHEVSTPLAVVLAIAVGAGIGVVSGLLVTKARIDSFIATLGLSSVLLAFISWISDDTQILGLPEGFQKLGNHQILGLRMPVWIMLVVALLVWYVLESTPAGRRVHATGGNADAARLAGVRTSHVVVLSLAACGAIAALTGVLLSAQIGAGDPNVGPSFLLPAFSAVFLGSTQFHNGRFNVWGTVAAVYVLATGVKGLQLAGAPVWIPDLFNGLALLLAVGLAKRQMKIGRKAGGRSLLSRRPWASASAR